MRDRRHDSHKEDIEDLYGEIRRLRKLVKLQKREIARLRRYEQKYSSSRGAEPAKLEENQVHASKPPKNPTCRTCGSNQTSIMDLGIRKYVICKYCGARKQI